MKLKVLSLQNLRTLWYLWNEVNGRNINNNSVQRMWKITNLFNKEEKTKR